MQKTLFVLYKNLTSAYDAAEDLQNHGFEPENVSFFASAYGRFVISDVAVTEGGNFGAVVGGLAGLLLVSGFVDIPGLGPMIQAGPLVVLLGGAVGAAIGIAVGVLIGALTAILVHGLRAANRLNLKTKEVHPGNALVTLRLNTNVIDEAIAILTRYHPLDVRYSNAAVHLDRRRRPERTGHYAVR